MAHRPMPNLLVRYSTHHYGVKPTHLPYLPGCYPANGERLPLDGETCLRCDMILPNTCSRHRLHHGFVVHLCAIPDHTQTVHLSSTKRLTTACGSMHDWTANSTPQSARPVRHQTAFPFFAKTWRSKQMTLSSLRVPLSRPFVAQTVERWKRLPQTDARNCYFVHPHCTSTVTHEKTALFETNARKVQWLA